MEPANCCNIPQLPTPVPAANSGGRHRANPATGLLRETSSGGADIPEIIHGESNSVRRNDVYRLQAL
jgi:hypothetical protein